MTPLIIHYINVCLMFYLMCCLSVLFTICSFNHTWEQLRCHTTFSNPAVTLHSATRLSLYIPQPGCHTTFSNPAATLHSATRLSHYIQQPGRHTTFSNPAVTLHSATRLSHYIQQPGRHIQLSICGIAVQRAATAALHSYITLWAINLFAEVHL